MIQQAYLINSWGKNVYVKIPVVNSKGLFMGKLIKELNNKDIKLNITAVYTSKQTKEILNNISSIVEEYDEPFSDSSQIPTFVSSQIQMYLENHLESNTNVTSAIVMSSFCLNM